MTIIRKILAPLLFLGLVVAKFAKFLFAILKFGKIGTLLSMLVSVWAYSVIFGWPFAVGFVLLLFIHELGHALVMRREGIAAGLPVFIPFVGAVISMRGLPRNAWVEAKVAFGGPLLGTVGALGALGIALYLQEPLFFALAKTGFLLNLFNMIPVSPMDGGRILGGVSKWFLIVGLVVGAVLNVLYLHSGLLFVMILFGCLQVWRTFRNPVEGYYQIPLVQRINTGFAYTALLAFLFWALDFTMPYLQHLTPQDDLAIYGGATLIGFSKLFDRS